MAIRQNIQNRHRSVGSCQNSGFMRFQYTSNTILLLWTRCCCGVVALLLHLRPNLTASKALLLHFLPLQQRISSYALSTITTMRMRSCYDLSAGAALIRCLCCTLELLLYKSAGNPGSAAAGHQASNKMDNRIVPVAMMQLAITNQRQARLDEENQPRRRRAKRFWVRPWLSADRRLQFGHSGGGGSGSAGAWRAGAQMPLPAVQAG